MIFLLYFLKFHLYFSILFMNENLKNMEELKLVGRYCKDCKIFTTEIEHSAISTIESIINNKVFANSTIRIMPDVHDGNGIVIGFSCKAGQYVSPAHVGCDIGCMMTTLLYPGIFHTSIPDLEHAIKTRIKFGFEIHPSCIVDKNEFFKVVNNEIHKVKLLNMHHIEVNEDYISKMLNRIGMDEAKFWNSLGTVGGGNHFIEVGINEKENVTGVTIHCGSRNFGLKVFSYWDNISKHHPVSKNALNEVINTIKKNEPLKTKWNDLIRQAKEKLMNAHVQGYLDGEELEGYLIDMVICQEYAKFNHYTISSIIKSIITELYHLSPIEKIQSVHNYIDFEDGMIRKGAIRSYVGEKMIIPFNMRDGLAICEGKSNPDWNFTAPHGAGRLLSRGKAKELISLDEYEKSMEGIYTTSVSQATIDESPFAYKNYKDILERITPTVNVLYLLKPIINIKSE